MVLRHYGAMALWCYGIKVLWHLKQIYGAMESADPSGVTRRVRYLVTEYRLWWGLGSVFLRSTPPLHPLPHAKTGKHLGATTETPDTLGGWGERGGEGDTQQTLVWHQKSTYKVLKHQFGIK